MNKENNNVIRQITGIDSVTFFINYLSTKEKDIYHSVLKNMAI